MRIRESFKLVSFPTAALTALAVLVSIFPAYAKTPAQQVGEAPGSPVSHMYGTFWQVGNGYSSELVLKNNDARNVAAVQVTLFGNAGRQVGSAQIQIPAHTVSRVDLSTIAGTQGGWGGLMLEFVGVVPQIAGKIVIVDSQRGASIELPLQGGYRYDTENALYAPWWLPDEGTEGRITLFNSSGQGIVVSASLTVDRAERVLDRLALKSHETKELSLRDLMRKMEVQGANTGSVTLRYSGPPHALQPALLLTNTGTGFVLVPAFNGKHDRQAAAETTWLFPDVQLLDNTQPGPGESTPLEAYALLSNGTKAALAPELVAYFGGGAGNKAQKASIPVDALKPFETRLVDLAQLLGNTKSLPAKLSRFAVGASHAGAPGDLGITVFSVRPTKDFVSRSAGIVVPPGIVDTSYWQIAGDQPVAVRNDGMASARTRVTLYYQTSYGVGSYSLSTINVGDKKSEKLGLAQLIHSGIADSNGNKIPSGTVFGVATLRLVGGDESGAIAVGSSPECVSDCGPGPLFASLSTSPLAGSEQPGDVRFAGVQPEGCPSPPTITGSNTVWWFNGQSPSGYSTSITLTSSGGASTTWAVTAGANKVNLSATTGASINMSSSGTAFSSAVGDITLTATVDGVRSSPFAITSREPYRLVAGTITQGCDSTYGYSDYLYYQIQDQLLADLPTVPIGEDWTAPAVQDYAGNNWGWPTAMSTTAAAGYFADHITGRAITGAIPVPVCTGTAAKVQHRNQSWYVGSLTIGVGVLVQIDVLGRFTNHGDHESIVSPP